MKALITGMNGTVAPVVYKELLKHNMDVIIWDRNEVSTDSEDAVYDFIKEVNPDLFFHIATGPVKWLEYIAKATEKLGVKLLFTSSVSVFSEKGTGPYDTTSVPNAEEDYGLYKIECEKVARAYNPNSVIIRLGWQIGSSAGTNNMFNFLTNTQEQNGYIEASSRWYPSCSFLEETAKTVVEAALTYEPGTYMANSNSEFTFYEIVNHLKEKHQTQWVVRETTSFVRDDRMFDDRVEISELF